MRELDICVCKHLISVYASDCYWLYDCYVIVWMNGCNCVGIVVFIWADACNSLGEYLYMCVLLCNIGLLWIG